MHRNFKNIDKVCYGKGAFNQLDDILGSKRNENDKFMVFIVDHYFKGKDLEGRIPLRNEDLIFFEDVDPHEPTTEQVDRLRDDILAQKGKPAGVIGIGGGSIMDIAKASSLMVNNENYDCYPEESIQKQRQVVKHGTAWIAAAFFLMH